MDPYGVLDEWELPEEFHQVGREYWARAPGSDVWVHFSDLPDGVEEKLWTKHRSQIAFPAGLEGMPTGIDGGGGVHRLPRVIPMKKAMGMILTGRRVPAREGFELGFVTEVVPQGQALEASKRWAAMILECSPKAVRASKQAAYRGQDEPSLERAMRTVYPAQQENLESLDYIEGPKAFAEKRKPNWQNR